jgi:hypothetical protein
LEELSMQTITTIGMDIAKSVFQVHGVDADGQVVISRQLKGRYVLAFFEKLSPCLVSEAGTTTSAFRVYRLNPTTQNGHLAAWTGAKKTLRLGLVTGAMRQ